MLRLVVKPNMEAIRGGTENHGKKAQETTRKDKPGGEKTAIEKRGEGQTKKYKKKGGGG